MGHCFKNVFCRKIINQHNGFPFSITSGIIFNASANEDYFIGMPAKTFFEDALSIQIAMHETAAFVFSSNVKSTLLS